MGGFSDNYECGYWGDETPPMQKNKKLKSDKVTNSLNIKNAYSVTSDENYKYLSILLTPINLLTPNEQEERTNLTQLCNTETALELRQNHKEIELYYDEIFIGFVAKKNDELDYTEVIDNFCLESNKIKELKAFWSGDIFFLRERIS